MPYTNSHHNNRTTSIKPCGKGCACRVCGRDLTKGTPVFHMNYWGTITIICLQCIEQFGRQASVILASENIKKLEAIRDRRP